MQFASEHKRQSVGVERPRPCASQEPVRLDSGQLVEGYCIDLLKMLKHVGLDLLDGLDFGLVFKALNFTYELYLVEDGKFGSVDENGNWDGMIGDLVLGKAEMAIGPISGSDPDQSPLQIRLNSLQFWPSGRMTSTSPFPFTIWSDSAF